MSKKCVGCGIELQNQNSQTLGYVHDLNQDMCKRCYRLKHYHEIQVMDKMDMKKVKESIKNIKGMVFFFVDVLQISREAISYFKKISNPKILVISKCDVLPKSISFNKIEKWIRDVFLVDSKILFVRKNSLSSLKKVVAEMKCNQGACFYFLGITNAGKSTFLNALLKYVDQIDSSILESELPNTTLDFIEISSSLGIIFDSVGICYPMPHLDSSLLLKAQAKKEIKPLIYPLKEVSRLLIEELIEIEVSKECSVVCLCSNSLNIVKVYKHQIDSKKLVVSLNGHSHLLIKGLGIFYFKEKVDLTIYGIDEEVIEVLPSFMGGTYE